MYFRDKFNDEIQILTRALPEIGASTTIGQFDTDLFIKKEEIVYEDDKRYINPVSKVEQKKVIKIFPLVMYDTLTSSNTNDIVYNNSDLSKNKYSGVIICNKVNGTVISCGRGEDE